MASSAAALAAALRSSMAWRSFVSLARRSFMSSSSVAYNFVSLARRSSVSLSLTSSSALSSEHPQVIGSCGGCGGGEGGEGGGGSGGGGEEAATSGAYEAVFASKNSAGLCSKPSWSKGTIMSCEVAEVWELLSCG
eukprot:scaffold44648_cov54-Phaeocystis_antarctica.AAC.1